MGWWNRNEFLEERLPRVGRSLVLLSAVVFCVSGTFGSVSCGSCWEASEKLRRWLLDRDDTILQLVVMLLAMAAVLAFSGVVAQGFIEKVLAVLFAGAGLVLCLVMLTVLLTEARGGEK